MTVVVEGATLTVIEISDDVIAKRIGSRLDAASSLSVAVKEVSKELGVKRRRVYKIALAIER